jgi:hypothetical protein
MSECVYIMGVSFGGGVLVSWLELVSSVFWFVGLLVCW